jgi:hypothetical protein
VDTAQLTVQATVWAAVAAAVSALIAAITAAITLFIARANIADSNANVRSADFGNCLDVVGRLADAQRKLRDAGTDQRIRDFEFREMLNLLEALALLVNDDKITPSTRKFTTLFLEEAWAFLDADEGNRALIAESRKSSETFIELKKFAKTHNARIVKLTAVYREQLDTQRADQLPPNPPNEDLLATKPERR